MDGMSLGVFGALFGALVTEYLLCEDGASTIHFLFDHRLSWVLYLSVALLSWEKAKLYALGIISMIIRRDTKWKKNARNISNLTKSSQRKRIIFIRHGESDWNLVFNKSKVNV